ncbi:MAG: hypothetical protein N5P05_000401 [Chroococcopsis gigantea SAG 12.99]|jgi:hypothetical protein|nr:hypothetical protein [Chroococcopsis gigantea SAG 12.99]
MDGICTLANDRIYHQLVALLNSIETMMGVDFPVCVYPYDDNTARIEAEIDQRPQVQLFSDRTALDRWDNFVRRLWDTHPTARSRWQKSGSQGYHRFGTHRRYPAFESPFERFLYMDGDTLLMSPVHFIFEQLNNYDCVTYDFQFKDPTHVYEVSNPKLLEVFPQNRIDREIFCSGFYASKVGLFAENQRDWLVKQLENDEAQILYPMAPDQTIVNYMMMRSNYRINNLAHSLPPDQRTGCCVTSPHFVDRDHILYDQDKRLTYIHYIGLASSVINAVSEGENIDFPYRDVFLHYRYLHEPEKRPQFTAPGKSLTTPAPNFARKVLGKLGINV